VPHIIFGLLHFGHEIDGDLLAVNGLRLNADIADRGGIVHDGRAFEGAPLQRLPAISLRNAAPEAIAFA
jgi:hypothetical protein